VIALSVAAALAIFVVYTALAGNGVVDLTPSTVAGHKGDVSLVGKVVGTAQTSDAYTNRGMRFQLKDIGRRDAARVPVVYHGAVPDQYKNGADLVVEGTLRNGVFMAKRGSMITKCPDHYGPTKSNAKT
jgi:cytochrome c-type biogenesis protein CcmE